MIDYRWSIIEEWGAYVKVLRTGLSVLGTMG